MAIELPEAITFAKQMNTELKGKIIKEVILADTDSAVSDGFINLFPAEFKSNLNDKTVTSVTAQGKWIFVHLDSAKIIALCPEAGGKLLFHESDNTLPEKIHLQIQFKDSTYMTLRNRGYGFILFAKEDELKKRRYPGKLGLSPFDEKFTFKYFTDILENNNKMLKTVLINQNDIAGIANSYLSDILFKAKIHPKRKASSLSDTERNNLYKATKEIISEATRLSGKEEFTDFYGKAGSYERKMSPKVKGKPCPNCGSTIEKVNIAGSFSYLCPKCQEFE